MHSFTLRKEERNARVLVWEGEPEHFVLSHWLSLRSIAIKVVSRWMEFNGSYEINHHSWQSDPQSKSVTFLQSNMKKRESRSLFLSIHVLQNPLLLAAVLSSTGIIGRRSHVSTGFLEPIPCIKRFPFPSMWDTGNEKRGTFDPGPLKGVTASRCNARQQLMWTHF